MESTVPFLLGVDGLRDNQLKKFNKFKKKQDPSWVDIQYCKEFRADPIWASIIPKSKGADQSSHDCRYVLIPTKFRNCITVHEYDGSEIGEINFHKYALDTIREILDNAALTDSERIEKIKEVYTFIASYKGDKPYIMLK